MIKIKTLLRAGRCSQQFNKPEAKVYQNVELELHSDGNTYKSSEKKIKDGQVLEDHQKGHIQ